MKKSIKSIVALMAIVLLCITLGAVTVWAGPPEPVSPDQVAGTYTASGEEDLVLNDDGTLEKNGVTCAFTVQKDTDPGGNVSYPVTVSAESDEDLAALGFPWYGGTFNLDLDAMTYTIKGDVMGAAIRDKSVISYENAANPESVTGYTTTITVADDGYENVYVLGMWDPKPAPADVNDIGSYSDEVLDVTAWENGMYYYGQSGKEAEKNADGNWEVSVDLASSLMNIVAFHDIANGGDLTKLMIPEDMYFVVEVPYDSKKQSESNDLTMAFANESQPGTVEFSIPWTAADGTSIPLSVYTPYGYDPDDNTMKYPVLYMIPGAGTTERTFFENCRANCIFDNFTEQGVTPPTIVVTMEGLNAEKYLTSEIVPYIEANYNAAGDAEHRALMGISMGSVAVSNIYLDEKQVDMFSKYCMFSGANLSVFGVNAEGYEFAEYDEAYLEKLKAPQVFIGAGGKDDFNMFMGQGNSTGTYVMKQWFDHYGIDVGYSVVPGNHHWETWVPLTIQFVGEYLAADQFGGPVVVDASEAADESDAAPAVSNSEETAASDAGEPAAGTVYTYTYISGMGSEETVAFEFVDDTLVHMSIPNTQITDVYEGKYEMDGNTVTITGFENLDTASPFPKPGLWNWINADGDCVVELDPEAGTFTPVA